MFSGFKKGFFNQEDKKQKKRKTNPNFGPRKEADAAKVATQGEIEAAITIQKHVRGYLARNKFQVHQLKPHQMEDYQTFVVGNDPVIKGHEGYKCPFDKVALVATSGLRALSIAAELGNKVVPKIILVDNSEQVCRFWIKLRELAQDDSKASDISIFISNFFDFISHNKHLYRDFDDTTFNHQNNGDVVYPNQNIKQFMLDLIESYGYNYVRAMICHTSIIKQSWGDKDTFAKIHNILAYNDVTQVFTYPSNILGCVQDPAIEQAIVANIARLEPIMTIYTEGVKEVSFFGKSIHAGKAHFVTSCEYAAVSKEIKLDENRLRPSQTNGSTRSNGSIQTIRIDLNNASELEMFLVMSLFVGRGTQQGPSFSSGNSNSKQPNRRFC